MLIIIHSDYFLKQNLPLDPGNGEVRVLFEVRTEFLNII
jgi:hypothetical protein